MSNIHTPDQHVLAKLAAIGAITAATVNGNVIDTRGYGKALITFTSAPSGGGTTSNAKLQSGDASDGSDAADVAGGAFVQVATADGTKTKTMTVDIHKLGKRYIRVPHTGAGGAAAGQFCIQVHLFNPVFTPVTQDVTPVRVI
jgi:hypothetical protein